MQNLNANTTSEHQGPLKGEDKRGCPSTVQGGPIWLAPHPRALTAGHISQAGT